MKQIKMTIVVSELGHPHLFQKLEGVLQPRARALLLKRLAEEGARAFIASRPLGASEGDRDAGAGAPVTAVFPTDGDVNDPLVADWFN